MKKTHKLIIGILCVLAIIIVGAVSFYIPLSGMEAPAETVDYADAELESLLETVPMGDVVAEDTERIGDTKNIINILLIGQDTRTQKDGNSDTMILCTLNKEKKTLVLTSFMRDMMVKIYNDDGSGYVKNRINVTYFWGGMPKLNKCLEDNFAVSIDHNVEVDFAGFTEIVDILGGVDINLSYLEAEYIKMDINDSKVKEGENHLNGAEALAYSRIRKIDSDFHRTERQRTVLLKILEKCKTMSISEALELAKTFMPLVTTDMSLADITGYVIELLPLMKELEITTQRIPADGAWWSANAGTEAMPMYVIIPDLEKNREILRETLGE